MVFGLSMFKSKKQKQAVAKVEPLVSSRWDGSPQDMARRLQPIYKRLIKEICSTQDPETLESAQLIEAVLEAADETKVPYPPDSVSYQNLLGGYVYANNCFPHHDFEVRVFIAILTWLLLLCDDAERIGMTADIEHFQQRWTAGQEQPSIMLESLAQYLQLSYTYYDHIVANFIVASALDFITATALAARGGQKRKTACPSPGGDKFPRFLRDKDGAGEAYAWFTFPKTQYPDVSVSIEVVKHISTFLCVANDVLSFYKEETSGEMDNFVHKVAACENKDTFAVLEELVNEAIDCDRMIGLILDGKAPYDKACRAHITGFIHSHIKMGRYKLWEVGFGSKPDHGDALR